MELDELRKMKDTVETAARDVESSMRNQASDLEKDWSDATKDLRDDSNMTSASSFGSYDAEGGYTGLDTHSSVVPSYRHPRKNWRVKRGAVPQWYKARAGVQQGPVGCGTRGALSPQEVPLNMQLSSLPAARSAMADPRGRLGCPHVALCP
jgi:hypothetical protein